MSKRDGLTIELAFCEKTLLDEIADPRMKRRDIAQTYRLAMQSSENEKVNWAVVNQAIIARWSLSALKWIKESAWSGKAFAAIRTEGTGRKG